MTTKRKTKTATRPKPRVRTAVAVATTAALVPARREVMEVQINDPTRMLPPAPSAMNVLGDDAVIGTFGMTEVTLTEKEEATLSEPVLKAEVLIKPTGQVYLPHTAYIRWFGRAFGRTGFQLVPMSKPTRAGSGKVQVVVPYMFFIHGKAAAFVYGEQEYFESNKEQSYGDAVEATRASGYRRCAKQLGVGLELWERRWCVAFQDEFCVKVFIESDDKYFWRRKDEPKFWQEEKQEKDQKSGGRRDAQPQRQAGSTHQAEPPVAGHHDKTDEPITDPQRKRLWVIMQKAGTNEDAFMGWLQTRYQLSSTRQITRRIYDEVCKAVEAGTIQVAAREPGEEG